MSVHSFAKGSGHSKGRLRAPRLQLHRRPKSRPGIAPVPPQVRKPGISSPPKKGVPPAPLEHTKTEPFKTPSYAGMSSHKDADQSSAGEADEEADGDASPSNLWHSLIECLETWSLRTLRAGLAFALVVLGLVVPHKCAVVVTPLLGLVCCTTMGTPSMWVVVVCWNLRVVLGLATGA